MLIRWVELGVEQNARWVFLNTESSRMGLFGLCFLPKYQTIRFRYCLAYGVFSLLFLTVPAHCVAGVVHSNPKRQVLAI
jgi:hypothetical protein